MGYKLRPPNHRRFIQRPHERAITRAPTSHPILENRVAEEKDLPCSSSEITKENLMRPQINQAETENRGLPGRTVVRFRTASSTAPSTFFASAFGFYPYFTTLRRDRGVQVKKVVVEFQ